MKEVCSSNWECSGDLPRTSFDGHLSDTAALEFKSGNRIQVNKSSPGFPFPFLSLFSTFFTNGQQTSSSSKGFFWHWFQTSKPLVLINSSLLHGFHHLLANRSINLHFILHRIPHDLETNTMKTLYFRISWSDSCHQLFWIKSNLISRTWVKERSRVSPRRWNGGEWMVAIY